MLETAVFGQNDLCQISSLLPREESERIYFPIKKMKFVVVVI